MKYPNEFRAARRFLRRLCRLDNLPDVTTDFSRFMYTRATIVHRHDTTMLLSVPRVLVDTGAHGGNYVSRKFLTANKDFLHPNITKADTSVF